jgi:hypothetical protein
MLFTKPKKENHLLRNTALIGGGIGLTGLGGYALLRKGKPGFVKNFFKSPNGVGIKSKTPKPPNYYQPLGLTDTVTNDEIKKSFRALAKQYHPDSSISPNIEKFQQINDAYSNLKKMRGFSYCLCDVVEFSNRK